MSFSFLDLIGMFGIILSCFLVVLIWSSKSFRSDVNMFYSLAIISLSFSLTVTVFEDYIPSNGIMEVIYWPFLFPFALMMYVLKAVKDPLSSRKFVWLLALPCFTFSAFQLIDFTFDFDVYEWFSRGNDQFYTKIIEYLSLSHAPFAIALAGFSTVKIRKAKNMYEQEKNWLYFNTLSFLVFFVLWMLSDPFSALFDFPIWDYLLALLGILLAMVTYRGVHHLNLFEQRRQLNELQKLEVKTSKNSTVNDYNHESLSSRQKRYMEKLHSLMTNDLLYLNPDLTRSIVAKRLEISDGYLSELISKNFNCNFNDYINEFRVKRVINLFQNKQFDLFSIEAIGSESGFKSKSVFYKAFKKSTGKTPGEYRKLN